MMEISLNELLHLTEPDLARAKIKFNQYSKKDKADPLQEFLHNPEVVNNGWLFWKHGKSCFASGQIAICVIHISGDSWLLSTIKEVTEKLNVKDGVEFKGDEIDRYPYR